MNEELDSADASLKLGNDGSEENPIIDEIPYIEGEYTVIDEVVNPNRLDVKGSATINLESGSVLKIPKGIHVKSDCKLIIKGNGSLIIDRVDSNNAGIGGSMKADNAAELLAKPDIDGGLVGGDSLKPETFAKIAISC